jgi:hypothetical protein
MTLLRIQPSVPDPDFVVIDLEFGEATQAEETPSPQ